MLSFSCLQEHTGLCTETVLFIQITRSLPSQQKHHNSLIFCYVIQPDMHKNNLYWQSGTIA